MMVWEIWSRALVSCSRASAVGSLSMVREVPARVFMGSAFSVSISLLMPSRLVQPVWNFLWVSVHTEYWLSTVMRALRSLNARAAAAGSSA